MAHVNLITRDGRVPKNKYVVLPSGGGAPIASARYKSSAMDKALTLIHKTGRGWVVCEIELDRKTGRPVLCEVWSGR